MNHGFFELTTPQQLLGKLEREYQRMKELPLSTDMAFNFFVTAEHMLDWLYPGKENDTARKKARTSDVLLKITSHLANGAKHFKIEAKHHQSVEGTQITGGGGMFPASYWGRAYFGAGYFGSPQTLTVSLTEDAISAFGTTILAIDLAEKVLDYWQRKFPKD